MTPTALPPAGRRAHRHGHRQRPVPRRERARRGPAELDAPRPPSSATPATSCGRRHADARAAGGPAAPLERLLGRRGGETLALVLRNARRSLAGGTPCSTSPGSPHAGVLRAERSWERSLRFRERLPPAIERAGLVSRRLRTARAPVHVDREMAADRLQPALQCLQVHLPGPDRGRVGPPRGRSGAARRGHGHGDPTARAAPAVREIPPDRGLAGSDAGGHGHRAGPGERARQAAWRLPAGGERTRKRQHVQRPGPAGKRAPAGGKHPGAPHAGRDLSPRRAVPGRNARVRTSSPAVRAASGRDEAARTHPGGGRQRRHAGIPHPAALSPLGSRGGRRRRGGARRGAGGPVRPGALRR